MIRQQIGDLLEIEFEGGFYYVVVLTKIVMFGGNILFAHHGDGTRRSRVEILTHRQGFNVSADLLLPKKEGVVRRLHRFDDVSPYWLTKYAKLTNEHRLGHKALEWYIYRIDDLSGDHIARRRRMPRKYRRAMDASTWSFDQVARMIREGYTPERNPFLEGGRG